jgi:transcriptional regulator with XRE-family HTH domain
MTVEKKSSLKELSKLTGIPQPSLSRFFSSGSMPRRTTLLKIAHALKLDAVTIATEWYR